MTSSEKKGNKKKFLVLLLVVLLLALAVGYAVFSDTLTITGTANAIGKFDLEFTSARVVSSQGVRTTGTNPTGVAISADKNTLTVTVADLGYPGAGAQFEAVITNVGTVPAKVKAVTPTNITGDGHAIVITGLDAITTSHPTLDVNDTCTINFTVEWDSDEPLQDATNGDTCSFELEIEYEQDTTDFTGTASHADS